MLKQVSSSPQLGVYFLKLISAVDSLRVQLPSHYFEPPCDITAELTHAETFLFTFISAKAVWNTKDVDWNNEEMYPYAYLLEDY
jgi:hypothetical protein